MNDIKQKDKSVKKLLEKITERGDTIRKLKERLATELGQRAATISQLTKYLNEMLGAEKGACQIDHRGDCRSHARFGVCGHCPVAAASAYIAARKAEELE